jgi:rhodanese-related sulfurtransferase
MKTLTTEELKARLEAGPLALFDVRGDVEYEKGHIPGAMTAPLGSLVFRVRRVMNPDSEVVVYSSGGACTLAGDAVRRLENLGMRNMFCYTGGMEAWQAAGHEVEASIKPKDHAWGPVQEVRPLIVDRDRAYGGVFKNKPTDSEGAGG